MSDRELKVFIQALTILSVACACSGFIPVDNYRVDCGSSKDTRVGNRVFSADNSTTYSLSTPKIIFAKTSESVTSSDDSFLYQTARILDGTSKYSFSIRQTGRHWIRLYFYPFVHDKYNMKSAKFDVLGQDHVLLSNFSVKYHVVKEFSVNVTSNTLEITFRIPSKNSFAFLNALEVVSVPDGLITEDASTFNPPGEFKGLFSQALETLYRVNMGGPIIFPENDTPGRTWVSDQIFLVNPNVATRISDISAVKYTEGATPDIAPPAVYGTATIMKPSAGDVNVTWEFTIDPGFQYLVRFHFCDILSNAPDQLFFHVYIDSWVLVYNFAPSSFSSNTLVSALYIDFVTAFTVINKLRVSVGPSFLGVEPTAILNGLEIMKMNNSLGSLSGSATLLSGSVSYKKHVGMMVGFITGAVIAVVVIAAIVFMLCRKRKKFACQGHSKTECKNSSTRYRIPFVAVVEATNNFDDNWVIGIGGFGKVYNGVLKDGLKVAVKRSNPFSRQGLAEFQTEVEMLSQFRHCNLVSLIGYCDEKNEMILIYEYMENGTLKDHLYGSGQKARDIGAARGLHYLHTGYSKTIIHRDVKSANILLDENLTAKVADFGLAKKVPEIDQSHVSTAVKGSFGYLDPDYYRRQQLTEKSDVYSFGMVLFEVLCARPVTDSTLPEGMNLANWAMEWQEKGKLEQVIRADSLGIYWKTAEKCLAEHRIDRPAMGDVLRNLEYALQLQEAVYTNTCVY
uniref:Protein kinase domain-containing protein n=1 Tax=Manihot esculenta TaxID=3983 RepID=A0A2C9W1R7_MANES